MTSIETRPSTEEHFIPSGPDSTSPLLIRPENREHRNQALLDFDKPEINRQKYSRASRPGLSELLVNAEALIQAGEKATAAHLIRQALNLDSHHPEALKKMLRTLGNQEWEQKQKLAILKTLVEVEPVFEHFARLGFALMDRGELDSALDAFFDATLRIEDENELLFELYKNMGNVFVRKADFESAEESYHKAFTLKPDSDILQVNLGTLAIQKNEWATALEKFRKGVEINSQNDKAWVGLALCHAQFGDRVLAQATLANALDLCPGNRTAVHLMANWCAASNEVQPAICRLQDYLAVVEKDSEMSLLLIHLFCQGRRYDLARLELERALCWEPDRSDLINLRPHLEKALTEECV